MPIDTFSQEPSPEKRIEDFTLKEYNLLLLFALAARLKIEIYFGYSPKIYHTIPGIQVGLNLGAQLDFKVSNGKCIIKPPRFGIQSEGCLSYPLNQIYAPLSWGEGRVHVGAELREKAWKPLVHHELKKLFMMDPFGGLPGFKVNSRVFDLVLPEISLFSGAVRFRVQPGINLQHAKSCVNRWSQHHEMSNPVRPIRTRLMHFGNGISQFRDKIGRELIIYSQMPLLE